jgi:hypothetical protein
VPAAGYGNWPAVGKLGRNKSFLLLFFKKDVLPFVTELSHSIRAIAHPSLPIKQCLPPE